MEIDYKKQFVKDLVKLPQTFRERIETLVFETIPNQSYNEIMQNVSKLKGQDNYYKIRVGDYRIGIYIKNDYMEFKRVLHRKEIYRYFP